MSCIEQKQFEYNIFYVTYYFRFKNLSIIHTILNNTNKILKSDDNRIIS